MIVTQEQVDDAQVQFDEPEQRKELAGYLRRQVYEQVGAHGGLLAHTTGHALAVPGKLLRPQLLLDACEAAGGDPDRAFPAAAGTEYGHIASLIHDDIIDGDEQRRGQPALHVAYGVGAAILTGDLFIFQTFLNYTLCRDRGVSAERVLEAIRILSSTCIEVCEGQALEARIAGDLETDERTYLRMIRLKSASVCRAATQIGACLAEAPPEMVEALGTYGEKLGSAFQIIDDILAYEGRAFRLGKPLYSDLANGRVTLPIIYALQSGSPALRRRTARLFAEPHLDASERYRELAGLLASSGALARARASAEELIGQARSQLHRLPQSPARDRLEMLADLVLTRDH